jgi:hypothetical protein
MMLYVLSRYVLMSLPLVAAFGLDWRLGLGAVGGLGLGAFIVALLRFPALRAALQRVEQRGRGGWVYAFYDRGQWLPVVKIGREAERFSRLAAHRTGAPFDVGVLFSVRVRDAVAAEALLHRRYAMSRYHLEWFMITPVMWFELRLIRWFIR